MPREVVVPIQPLERYRPFVAPEVFDRAEAAARAFADRLKGRVLWNINSTAAGGGVAETAAAEPPKPVERPVAKTREEVLTYIDQGVDSKNDEIKACVDAYRKRVNDPQAKLHVQIGIDQEGTVMGVSVKKKAGDDEAAQCVRTAISTAIFPRSLKAGVITVDKVFEFIAVYR